jgi:iron complex transport system substrate-binding protein
MYKKLLPLLLLISVVLAACSPATVVPTLAPTTAPTVAPTTPPTEVPEPTAEPTAAPTEAVAEAIVITDGLGREVTLDAPATSIVSLAPSNTEILFALGAGDTLIGRDEFSDYPPEALDVTSIGSLYPSVNAEAIVALQPDLVLAAGVTNPDDVQKLEDLGLTVYSTQFDVTLDDIYEDITNVAILVGKEVEAEAVVQSLKDRVDAVETTTATAAEQPVVFYEVDATEPNKPWTAGSGTFVDRLITSAGGINAGGSTPDYFQMSIEELVVQNPDIIVLGSATYGGQTPELVAARPGWETIAAVQNNAVYTFDDNLISRPGPRIVDGLEALAKLIHPELFE